MECAYQSCNARARSVNSAYSGIAAEHVKKLLSIAPTLWCCSANSPRLLDKLSSTDSELPVSWWIWSNFQTGTAHGRDISVSRLDPLWFHDCCDLTWIREYCKWKQQRLAEMSGHKNTTMWQTTNRRTTRLLDAQRFSWRFPENGRRCMSMQPTAQMWSRSSTPAWFKRLSCCCLRAFTQKWASMCSCFTSAEDLCISYKI